MKKLLCLIFSVLFITAANAASDPLQSCLQKISTNDSAWKSGITNIFGNSDLDDTIVEQNKAKIYLLLTERFKDLCGAELIQIAKTSGERARIDFTHKNKSYAFDFCLEKIFDNLGLQMGILVINRRDLYPTKVLKLSEIPKKQKFFTDECSDWTIFDNLDDDSAVNVAGQSVFTEYGGSKEEFFLDFAEGDNRRAFPGLVIKDKTGSSEEEIVSYANIKTAVQRTEQFANQLKNGPCSQKGLSVYLVALNVQQTPVNTSDNHDLSASVVAVSGAATGGIVGGVMGISAVATWMGLAGAAATAVPIAGWVVGGVLVAAGGIVALWPQKITDIQQVMILDGPFDL